MSTVLTKSKERPILFSGPMVWAIFEGRKTVTRRPPIGKTELKIVDETYSHYIRNRRGTWDSYKTLNELVERHCPYGKPGDVLWVRETWQDDGREFRYRATDFEDQAGYIRPLVTKWKPSIFMPYAACRLKLRVTDVRVERLKQIAAAQCIAEGIEIERDINTACGEIEAFEKFQTLWDSINERRGYAFDLNPYVWVVEFECI